MVEDNAEQPVQEVEEVPKKQLEQALTEANMNNNGLVNQGTNVALKQVLQELSKPRVKNPVVSEPEKRSTDQSSQKLSSDEEKQLDQYVKDILNNRNPDLKTVLTNSQQPTEDASAPEIEEIIPLTSENSQDQLLLLKKDSEKFNNADMGLANTVHKIVKGGIQRVEGNRVYLKVAKDNITEEELYKLIAYLDRKIAEPNSLYFDEFLYEDEHQKKKKTEKELENASEWLRLFTNAERTFKHLLEFKWMRLALAVEWTWFQWREQNVTGYLSNSGCKSTPFLQVQLPEVIDHLEGKPCTVYEDLCRQRMNTQDVPIAVNIGKATSSKHSSTSSWPDECLLQTSQMDISTGHVILSFLQDCLKKPNEISDQWTSLEHYESNTNTQTSVASSDQNADKNFDKSVIPYDESLVTLNRQQQQPTSSANNLVNVESESSNTYINASKIMTVTQDK
uniref:Uncharacterized protein n=1 Tax=Ditylenchus dipsaci TaxID=166011 RepID=A0A915DRY9_9BILA